MPRLLSDLRFGLRMLLKTPTATLTVLVALSLGIGLCALMFSLIQGGVLATLPVDGGDRIMRISRVERLAQHMDDYPLWAARQRSFDGLGAVEMSTVTLAIEGAGAEPVRSAAMTPSILPILRVQPAIGRPFSEDDATPGAPPVVLLSDRVWRGRLGADPNVIGRIVRVDGTPAEVIGVMPEGFGFPWDEDVWSALPTPPPTGDPTPVIRPAEGWFVIGRLRDGVSRDAAAAELTAITRELDRATRGTGTGAESLVAVSSYTDLFSEAGMSAALAAVMLAVAFLVLLVACANVTNVLLARAIARRREIVVRLAIGASRTRIATQLFTEIALLAAFGAVGGVGVALVGTRYITAAVPPGMPYWIAFEVNWPMLVFIAFVAVVAAVMAGLLPALQASRSNTHELLKDDSRGTSSFRLGRIMRRLVGVEMALSFVLLVLAGLFIRSAVNFSQVEFPFQPENVYTARMGIPAASYADASDRAQLAERLLTDLAALPEATGVALSTAVPGVGGSPVAPIELEGVAQGAPENAPRARSIVVTPGYFDLFRSAIVAGRDFDSRDRLESLPVAIVNESFARRHFPDGAVDRRIRLAAAGGEEVWLTVVGVSQDLSEGGIEGEIVETVYRPVLQAAPAALTVVARSRTGYEALAAPVRETVRSLDPDIALFSVQDHQTVVDLANSSHTWFSALFLVSGAVALFLAALGLYGVMAFWVIQRTREIGVRMALGGRRTDIIRLVLGQGMRQISFGLAAGVVLAIPVAQLLRSGFFGVAPYDPLVFGAVLAVLIGSAWLGCWLPARRATRMDPLHALAAE